MHLLVSVTCAAEAASALAGGADIIDAKNPAAGALGAVTLEELREIQSAVAARRPLSAALGEAINEVAVERQTREYVAAGADFVKIGFADIGRIHEVVALTAAAVRGARKGSDGRAGVVAVAYADLERSITPAPGSFVDAAANGGAVGVLLDTSDKSGPGLVALMPFEVIASLVRESHERGLFVALAGRLTAGDLPLLLGTGTDIAGVRGAACVGGRDGRVAIDRVRQLKELCLRPTSCNAERSSSSRSANTNTGETWLGNARAK